MTVEDLIIKNMMLTDIIIEVRVNGCALLDQLNIGLDYGVKPPYPTMVPIDKKHIGNQCLTAKKEAKYIRKSINAWDDGKDYWELKLNRIPKGYLELEVFSWESWSVYRRHHPRSEHNPSDSYNGIKIVAMPKGEEAPEIIIEKKQNVDDGQIKLF